MTTPEKPETAAQPALEALWIHIQNSRIDTFDGHHSFVPPASLSAIFTPAAIAGAVAELPCTAEDRLGLVDAIRHGGIRTFALLVSISRPGLVVAFRRKRCLDRLPLDEVTARQAAGEYAPTFLRVQWEFAPYHFQREPDVDIGREILPFVRDLGPLSPGGFGDIRKLEIHPGLQDFAPRESKQVVVVRKLLRREKDVTDEAHRSLFNNEKRCLRLINHPPHPNIVPLLTAYVHGTDHCMLFPLLDMDLKAFLSRETPYGNFRHRFTYFSALHGLASALARVHEVRVRSDGAAFDGVGYHHDLRPVNVLVSRETFVLADFGLGRVRELEDGSTSRLKAVAGVYVAPECLDDDFVPLDVGRPVDVWAFACVASEVMTYAYLGVSGLAQFRATRKVPRPSGEGRDSFFHDGRGMVKTTVKRWIVSLACHERPALRVPLQHLLLSIFTPVDTRPNISSVCLVLAHLSLAAHFFAVLDALTDLFGHGDDVPRRASLMKLWFERERLRAFGRVLCLFSTTVDDAMAEFARAHGDGCVKVLLELFDRIPRPEASSVVLAEADGPQPPDELRPAPMLQSPGSVPSPPYRLEDKLDAAPYPPVVADVVEERHSLDADVQRLIHQLWGLLSEDKTRKAERIWVHSMLDATDDIDQLGTIETSLSSQRPIAYQQGAALAAMKKIRLQILHGPDSSELAGLEISEAMPKYHVKLTHGHQMGDYKHGTRVLIESVYYDSSWDKIPPVERTLVMAQKAQGFNPKPRPSSLRLLDCLGFFQTGNDGDQEGFSFVYQVPEPSCSGPNPDPDLDPDPMLSSSGLMTLNRVLFLSARQSKTDPHLRQPLLGDKFRLAGTLAGFLAEFHCTGWLHENFHSNNIVYFNLPSTLDDRGISPTTSNALGEPFVVGLNKSRPGGEAWHTRGPSLETDFLDYRHPAYERTKRFRIGYDYYSLGVVLLEIGLWTPLKAISTRREYRTLSPERMRDVLVSRFVPRLGYKMGQTFQDVVHALLSDQLDPEPEREVADAERESRAFSAFLEVVVGPLEQLASGIL